MEPEIGEDVPIPFRPRAPKAFRRKGRLAANPRFQQSDPDRIAVEGWANIRFKWFSLHAGVVIKGDDRVGLKRLFRYAARPSVTLSMLSYVTPDDPVISSSRLASQLHLKSHLEWVRMSDFKKYLRGIYMARYPRRES